MSLNNCIILFLLNILITYSECLSNKPFPKNFKFGAATAAYQVEGAWNADDKSESNWDNLIHQTPSPVLDNSTADIACDSFHKYKEDVALLKNLGANHYRFSISWTRLIPDGTSGKMSEAGYTYYKNLIDELIKNGIEPLVTIFHWDLPNNLQKLGGWANPAIVDFYMNYVDLVFELFGENVKTWLTFNEPHVICTNISPMFAQNYGIIEYLCIRNILIAHAKAYRLYDEKYRPTQKGRVSLALNTGWYESETQSEEDLKATERAISFQLGIFAHPIFHGNFPQIVIDQVKKNSMKEGFIRSRLPELTEEEINYIKGTHDFIALNHYSSSMVRHLNNNMKRQFKTATFANDVEADIYMDPEWETTVVDWLTVVPWGLRKILTYIKETYNNTEIIITENGYPTGGDDLDNPRRLNYYQEYLSNILDAIYKDGVNVSAYTIWSLIDNFEWLQGYTKKFGIYHVNFTDPERTRTPKEAVDFFKQLIVTRCLVEECEE